MTKKINNERITTLLLSGAKMTGNHCKKCLYPLFEKNGELFCPNCGSEKKEDLTRDGIVDEKIEFLYIELKQATTVEEIKEIGKAIEILRRLKST
ncbi:MAG: Sjogren's syndrome/scleroderma autoantigen 1 family protein [Euryarchaeota archaeon]|nr:Sjogren's syndrome/scleroderma autoantigen 1 family protein [Euryarchaeota archaeon]